MELVSIHASAREATCTGATGFAKPERFNPRLRTGGDCPYTTVPWLTGKFQSTPPHGRRPRPAPRLSWPKLFQSTPPHGRRRPSPWPWRGTRKSFNPRLRTGGDSCIITSDGGEVQFQSTPPHGRRLLPRATRKRTKMFQSTPPHGRRHKGLYARITAKPVSIHASAREATRD